MIVPVLKMLLYTDCTKKKLYACLFFISTETYDDFDTRILEVGMTNLVPS